MPIVTVTLRKPKSAEFKEAVLGAVHAGLVSAGVNPGDRFQRVLELEADDFRFDAAFPDVRTRRTADFVLVEILLGAGRSAETKRQIVATILQGLAPTGFDPENLMVCFQDVAWENWSPAGGRMAKRFPLGALG
jgi:phenylpyruvate tautomerase PptA (4-oxalocrotonate tautomerase family)